MAMERLKLQREGQPVPAQRPDLSVMFEGYGALEVCERCGSNDCLMPVPDYIDGEAAICAVCDPRNGWPVAVAGWA